MVDERAEFVRSLRELADFYEVRPELPLPNSGYNWDLLACGGKEKLAWMATLLKPCEKDFKGVLAKVFRRFGPFKLEAYTLRSNVCERVVVGTRTVPEKIIPAQVKEIVPEHEEDIVEWKCPDSLLAGEGAE